MRVPDEILKCVAFLAYESTDGPRLAGTAFFLGRDLGEPDYYAVYLVTAKHVIDGIREKAISDRVFVRVNQKEASAVALTTDLDSWVSDPDDPFVDVAMLQVAPLQDEYDYLVLPESRIATDEVISTNGIGVGDDAFLTGLFKNHVGRHRNIPIVRTGNIAAMPEEPVRTNFHGTLAWIDAYLLEVRSIGGLSGSPVFVVTSGFRGHGVITVGPQFFLLGLVHGHWDLPFTAPDEVSPNSLRSEAINTGIAMVVPASKIVDVTDRAEFVEVRRTMAANIVREPVLPAEVDETSEP
jgi:hypothetical protein